MPSKEAFEAVDRLKLKPWEREPVAAALDAYAAARVAEARAQAFEEAQEYALGIADTIKGIAPKETKAIKGLLCRVADGIRALNCTP